MSVSGPVKPCPRCNTQLPAQAAFCSSCGLSFASPASAGFGAASKKISKQWLAVIVIAALITLAVPGYLVFGGSGGGGNLFVDRHGLPGNVPLPDGVTFKAVEDESDSGGAAKEWYWLVASPNDATALRNFYQSNLPKNGWPNLQTRGSDGDYEVDGCGSHQGIYVEMVSDQSIDVDGAHGNDPRTLAPPAGGAILQMIVGNSESLMSYSKCS
jgi:hypothetical protein